MSPNENCWDSRVELAGTRVSKGTTSTWLKQPLPVQVHKSPKQTVMESVEPTSPAAATNNPLFEMFE